ncbi:MAG: 2TM domain-containing protein [Pricia sp.]|nr:2TM domain-containing protein [Pricia sp.]
MKTNLSSQYVRAKKKVERIKGFYSHLTFYLIVNVILIIGKTQIPEFFGANALENPDFYRWLEWNIIGTPIFWGLGLFLHGLYVYRFQSLSLKDLKPKFLVRWEEKQIKKYLEEDLDD